MAPADHVKITVTGDYLPLHRQGGVFEVMATPVAQEETVAAVEEIADVVADDAVQVHSRTLPTPPTVSDEVRAKYEETCMPYRSWCPYCVDGKKQEFVPWAESVQAISYSSTTPMGTVAVPTGETASINFWMDNLMVRSHGAMLIGPAGVGKTAIIVGKLRSLQRGLDVLGQ